MSDPGAGGPTGVVLAGGASSRMGRDKATLVVAGRSLAARAADALGRVCARVVVADRARGTVPGVSSVPDGPGRGPAAGVLGAARVAPGEPLLVLACDVPAVPDALLRELAGRPGADLLLPRSPGGPEPLVARYGPRALVALAAQVASGDHALRSLLGRDDLVIEVLEAEELARFGDPARIFANVNTPEDLEALGQPADRPRAGS